MKKTFVTRALAMLLCVAMLATVTPIFAAAETEITEITITNADVTPYIGEKAGDWLDYTLPENGHFTVDDHFWWDNVIECPFDSDDVFEENGNYQVGWWLIADEGYTFAENATVTINGETEIDWDNTYRPSNAENKFFVWTKDTEAVEKPAANVIDKIDITNADVTPYIGEKAGDWLDYTLPENCHFTMQDHYWYNETVARSMTSGDVFAAGSEYDLFWVFKADSGYTFSDEAAVTLNGSTALLDSYTSVDTDDLTLFYVWTKPTEAVEKPADIEITEITITDADITAIVGENPADYLEYTLPDDCHYSVVEHYWYCDTTHTENPGIFEEGKYYSTCFRFKPDEGYVFAEDVTATLNGSPISAGDVRHSDDDVYFWTVEKFAEKIITKIHITDADVTPYIGEKAGDWLDYTLPANCHYTAEREYWHREGTDGGEVLSDDVFEEGVSYDRYWYFKADEGYVFDENAVITINGSTALVDTFFSRYYENEFSVWTKPTDAVEKPADIEITEIAITDADVTAYIGEKAGDYLAYTLPDDCHFTVDEHYWYDESAENPVDDDATFAADGFYDTCWQLIADEGYTFAENATVTINGQTDILDPNFTEIDDEDNTIFYVWTNPAKAVEKPADIEITEITITDANVTAYIGEKVGDYLAYTLPDDCHFTVDEHFWWNDTDGGSLSTDDTFKADIRYDVGWRLKADEGYTFAENATVTINGQTDILDPNFTEIDDVDNTRFFVWTNPAEAVELIVIDKIEITDVDLLPIIGDKTNDHIDYTFPENCHFTAAKHGWFDETDDTWVDGADDTFVAGHTYQVGWWLDADEGYTFAEDPTVTINGEENINWGDTYINKENPMRFYVWSESIEAVEPTEKLLGDANDDGNVNMKDVLLMRKFLAGIDVTYNAQNADCNEDGTVNMKDVLQLRKYLAGLITELGA